MRMLGFVRSNFSRAVTNNTKYNAKREGTHKINKHGFGEQMADSGKKICGFKGDSCGRSLSN